MLVAGDHSPHLRETVAMNSRMDPATCNFVKVGYIWRLLRHLTDELLFIFQVSVFLQLNLFLHTATCENTACIVKQIQEGVKIYCYW